MRKRPKPKKDFDKKIKADIFIIVDSHSWRKPDEIDIEALGDLLEVNVGIVDFIDQDVSINRPPETYPVDTKLHLSADQNFLYVWVKDRWKRIPLAEF